MGASHPSLFLGWFFILIKVFWVYQLILMAVRQLFAKLGSEFSSFRSFLLFSHFRIRLRNLDFFFIVLHPNNHHILLRQSNGFPLCVSQVVYVLILSGYGHSRQKPVFLWLQHWQGKKRKNSLIYISIYNRLKRIVTVWVQEWFIFLPFCLIYF
jgi:hypothetical protein